MNIAITGHKKYQSEVANLIKLTLNQNGYDVTVKFNGKISSRSPHAEAKCSVAISLRNATKGSGND